jgi:hypothetical protein
VKPATKPKNSREEEALQREAVLANRTRLALSEAAALRRSRLELLVAVKRLQRAATLVVTNLARAKELADVKPEYRQLLVDALNDSHASLVGFVKEGGPR